MQTADVLLNIYQKRGAEGLPLERVYRHLFDPELFLKAYGKIYRNFGAMTRGTTTETVDGMCLSKIQTIIGLLRLERYAWTPVRRTMIPKANGKMRPLGIPTWGDKIVQEVLRSLLEPYYEQRFSHNSHGFRPNRSCHTALREIQKTWKGTNWFIEGDIKGCFDNIDHSVLLDIIRRDIHDGRLVKLIEGLLKAGYMEDWKYHDTLSGTPQGGIISPLLANIYLNDLDRYVEGTLIPAYTTGERRRWNGAYTKLTNGIHDARERDDLETARRLRSERRMMPSQDVNDPGYRRLRYIRYADDFILGFAGPRNEAEEIRRQLGEFLERNLHLTLSPEKTLITHASGDKAKFLGYEITASRSNTLVSESGKRTVNGSISLLMPRKVASKYRTLYSEGGEVIHRTDLMDDTDYTIVARYQSVLRGLYNFYCMATNVSRRMAPVWWILETSMTKTLAHKHKVTVTEIYRQYHQLTPEGRVLQVVLERPGKKPLTATFGGFPLKRIPGGLGMGEFSHWQAWNLRAGRRAEVVQRLLAGKCELCGAEGVPLHMHHIRKLADIDRPGRRPKAPWEKVMAARRRKSLAVCRPCHDDIHAGRHDGPRL